MFGEYAQIATYYNRDASGSGDFIVGSLPQHLLPPHTTPTNLWGGSGIRGSVSQGQQFTEDQMEDFIMVAEFSEIEGPKPVLTIPKDAETSIDLNALSVKIMAVDHQTTSDSGFSISEDTQVVLSDDVSGVSAFVHHFVLYDNQARGFVRPYCMVFVSYDIRKIMLFYEELSSQFKRAARFLKYGNRLLFVKDLESHLLNLEHTKGYLLNQVSRMRLKGNAGDGNANSEDSKASNSVDNELLKRLQNIHQSSTELRDILSIMKPLLHDRRLESKFRVLEDRAFHRGHEDYMQAEKLSLQEDHFADSLYGSPVDVGGTSGSLNDYVSPVSLFKTAPSHTPLLVETKKAKRFNSPLRGLHELCSWGAKEGLRKLRGIHEYFKRDAMILELEKNESRLTEPSNSMVQHGHCVTSNVLSGVSMRGSSICMSEDSSSMFLSSGRLTKWPSCASDDTLESFKSVDSYLSCPDEEENASLYSFVSNGSSTGITTSASGQDFVSAPTSPMTEEVAFPPPQTTNATTKAPQRFNTSETPHKLTPASSPQCDAMPKSILHKTNSSDSTGAGGGFSSMPATPPKKNGNNISGSPSRVVLRESLVHGTDRKGSPFTELHLPSEADTVVSMNSLATDSMDLEFKSLVAPVSSVESKSTNSKENESNNAMATSHESIADVAINNLLSEGVSVDFNNPRENESKTIANNTLQLQEKVGKSEEDFIAGAKPGAGVKENSKSKENSNVNENSKVDADEENSKNVPVQQSEGSISDPSIIEQQTSNQSVMEVSSTSAVRKMSNRTDTVTGEQSNYNSGAGVENNEQNTAFDEQNTVMTEAGGEVKEEGTRVMVVNEQNVGTQQRETDSDMQNNSEEGTPQVEKGNCSKPLQLEIKGPSSTSPSSLPLMALNPGAQIRATHKKHLEKETSSVGSLEKLADSSPKRQDIWKLESTDSLKNIPDSISIAQTDEGCCDFESTSGNTCTFTAVFTPNSDQCLWKPKHGVFTSGDILNSLGPGIPGYGIHNVMGTYNNLQPVIFSLLTGRTVLIVGPAKMEVEVIRVVTALSIFLTETKRKQHCILDWMNRPLKVTDLMRIRLAGICRSEKRSMDATIPLAVKQYSTIMDIERRVIIGPLYQGGLINVVIQQKRIFRSDVQFVAFIHSWLMELSSKAFIFYHSFCLGDAGGLAHSYSLEKHREQYNATVNSLMNRLGVRDQDITIIEHIAEKVKLSQVEPHIWVNVDKGSVVHPLTVLSRGNQTFRC